MNANDIEIALRARAAFNDSVERLDTDTCKRLREVRLRAQNGEARSTGVRWAWPAGAAVTAALALMVLLPQFRVGLTTESPPTQVAVVARHVPASTTLAHAQTTSIAENAMQNPIEGASEDMPSVETTDPDLLSDLDFYGWLAKQQNSDNAGG